MNGSQSYTGMSQYVNLFDSDAAPLPADIPEPPSDRRKRAKEERMAQHEVFIAEQREMYKPTENPAAKSDPYRTLFVGRLAYETTERNLQRVFEEWGPVTAVRIVTDREGRSRGYAFIEYETERDLRDAYKHADGIKIDGRSVIVDVERGRTVPGWFPRRLGGGKGPGRDGRPARQAKRKMPPPRNDFRSHGDRHRRSPPRGHYQPPSKFSRDSRDSSRRSSFNY